MRISDWSSDVCSSDLHHRSQLAGVSGHGKANSSGGNAAEIRLHARDLVAGSLKAGDFTLLDDIDTQSVGRPGVTPSHRIVSRGAGACLIDGTEDWKSPISIERRFYGESLVRLKPYCVHPIDLNGVHHAAKAFTQI